MICVEGHADVTKYVKSHPGGWLPLVNLAGKDATDAFAIIIRAQCINIFFLRTTLRLRL